MDTDDQAAWQAYEARKRGERLREAAHVWKALESAGVHSDVVLALDFVHFGHSRERADGLREQLAESYSCTVEDGPEGYWLVKGTTRPYGVTLSRAEHDRWVAFMCDVARSHGCVFSTWSLTAPALGVTVSSEEFEDAG